MVAGFGLGLAGRMTLPTDGTEYLAATIMLLEADQAFTDAFALMTMARGVEPSNADYLPGSGSDMLVQLLEWRREAGRLSACAVALANIASVLAGALAKERNQDPLEWLRATALRHQAGLA